MKEPNVHYVGHCCKGTVVSSDWSKVTCSDCLEHAYRGYAIDNTVSGYIFRDNGLPVANNYHVRPCGHCKLHNTIEDHDGCIGALKGKVLNACCGHGVEKAAYVQLVGMRLEGRDAIIYMKKHKSKEFL